MSNDRTDAVIQAIDGALGDGSVSGDAMRWAPTLAAPASIELGHDQERPEDQQWFIPVATPREAQIAEYLMTEAGRQELHAAALAALSDDDMITVTIEPDTSRFDAALEELRASFIVFIDQVTRAALVLDQAGIHTVKDVDRRIRRWQVEQRRIRQAMRHVERRAARRQRRAARMAR